MSRGAARTLWLGMVLLLVVGGTIHLTTTATSHTQPFVEADPIPIPPAPLPTPPGKPIPPTPNPPPKPEPIPPAPIR